MRLGKMISGGVALAIGAFYFIANQFVTAEPIAHFEHEGAGYDLYIDRHPDGSIYLSLWDAEGTRLYAVTEWFRENGEVRADCAALAACFVIRDENAATGERTGWRLTANALERVVSEEELADDVTVGFEAFARGALAVASAREAPASQPLRLAGPAMRD